MGDPTLVEIPKNVEECLIKVYETTWFKHSDYKRREKNCNWAHLALSDDLNKASYLSIYPKDNYDFTRSNTLRLPTADQRHMVKSEEYVPQDISVLCSLFPDELPHIIKDVRKSYSDATRVGKFLWHKEKRIDDSRVVKVVNADYTLFFPLVYNGGKFAEGLENIFSEFMPAIASGGSKKFYDCYKIAMEKLKGVTSKPESGLNLFSPGMVKEVVDFILSD